MDGFRAECRACAGAAAKASYNKNPSAYKTRAKERTERVRVFAAKIIEHIRDTGRRVCGEREHCVLDFHHLQKGTNVTRAASDGRLSLFAAEVNKCVVLCANCHRKAHAGVIVVGPELLCKIETPVLPPLPEELRVKRIGVTHCRRGHDYTEENTTFYTDRHGARRRRCKTCHRENANAAYYRSKTK